MISNVATKFIRVFSDIDECSKGSHNCSADAVCNNTKGSYNCTCNPGYSGGGRTCKGTRLPISWYYIIILFIKWILLTNIVVGSVAAEW